MPIIFGTIRKASGEGDAGAKLLFRIEGNRAERFGNDVRSTRDILITADGSGFFSQPMDPGSYYVWIGGSDRSLVQVPSDTDYVLFADLYGPAPAAPPDFTERGQNWRLSNAERQLINADTGAYHSPFIGVILSQKELAFSATGAGGETANFRYREGMLELFCAEENTWHAPYLYDGVLTIAADGSDAQVVDRFMGGVWQLRDLATSRYRTWFVIGESGSETLGLGPEMT